MMWDFFKNKFKGDEEFTNPIINIPIKIRTHIVHVHFMFISIIQVKGPWSRFW